MSKDVVRFPAGTAFMEAETNEEGLVLLGHIAINHFETDNRFGEVLLCGSVIYYDTFKGKVENAPDCQTCMELYC